MANYYDLQTPQLDAVSPGNRPRAQQPTPSTAVHVVRFFIVLGIAVFIFGNIATWAPMYELNLLNTMMGWWNGYPGMSSPSGHHGHMGFIVDTGIGRNITESGHTEMIRPTFLFIFCIFPFIVSVLLIEYLRHINTARRLTSTLIWRFAMLMRRKPKFPVLGVSKFSVGEWLFGVVYVLGGNGLCWYFQWDRRIDSATAAGTLNTSKYWNIVGISSAYLAIYNMAFLLLPVTRNSGWMEFLNLSYANGVKFHRWIGFMTVITTVVHMAGYWVRLGTWQVNQFPCTNCDFELDNSGGGYYAWFNFFGFISTLAMILIIPTSFPIIRRNAYEWFYISHWVLFAIAVFFAILHWSQIIWWILPSGCVWLVSRATFSWNAMNPVLVKEFSVIGDGDDELVKVVVKRAAPGTSPSASSYDYKVGNFLYLNVPRVSKLEWHALTIASSPKLSPTDVILFVKPIGDWSKSLVQYAKECHHNNITPLIYMDGFYGASLEVYEDYPTVCLVSGGIGVTPVLAILDDLAAKLSSNGVSWTQRFTFIFTFRELSIFQAVAPLLAKLRQHDPHEQFFRVHLFATGIYSESDLGRKLEISPAKELPNEAAIKSTTGRDARPFYEPLRSSNMIRFIMYLVLYVVAIAVFFNVRWGNGVIQGDNHFELWPLQRAFELAMFCLSIVVVHGFVLYEYVMFRRRYAVTEPAPIYAPETPVSNIAAFGGDVHTVGDLLDNFNVVMGKRPDMHSLLQQTLEVHKMDDSSASFLLPVIGVMVSGPKALKMATNEAVYALSGGNFDVHEEEFEL